GCRGLIATCSEGASHPSSWPVHLLARSAYRARSEVRPESSSARRASRPPHRAAAEHHGPEGTPADFQFAPAHWPVVRSPEDRQPESNSPPTSRKRQSGRQRWCAGSCHSFLFQSTLSHTRPSTHAAGALAQTVASSSSKMTKRRTIQLRLRGLI